MASFSADRTKPATPHRRKLAEQLGQRPYSRHATLAAGWLACCVACGVCMPGLYDSMQSLVRTQLENVTSRSSVRECLIKAGTETARALAPLMLCLSIAAIGVHGLQWQRLALRRVLPQPSRMSPANAWHGLWHPARWGRIAIDLLAILAVTAVMATQWRSGCQRILELAGQPYETIVPQTGALLRDFSLFLAVALCTVGFTDYLYQRWQFERSLRMSDEEIRAEQKSLEGNRSLQHARRIAHRNLTRSEGK